MTSGLRWADCLRRLAYLPMVLAVATNLWAVQATLVADAHVSSTQPDVNSGTLSNLNVGGGYTALVQFDLGVLPAGTTAAQITHATLRLYCNRADTPGAVGVQPVNASWGEYSVTYNTLPPMGVAVGTVQIAQAGEFVTVDVTAAVQGWVSSPATNNGLALTAASAVVQFDSKENDETAHVPELEIALAAGGAGTVGPQGAVGPAGPAGLPGPAGPQGPQGPQGLGGPMGLPGPAGLTGATGTAGPAGMAGPQGLTGPQGSAGPQGVAGTAGPAGPQGSKGLQGPAGATGPQGPQGAAGPAGPAGQGLNFTGPYASGTNYAVGDVVSYGGSSYISLAVNNHGQTPGQAPVWMLLAAQGTAGDIGAAGAAGAPGVQGPAGAAGPSGAQGPAGPAGAAGAPGINFRGAWTQPTNYAVNDAVTFAGSTYLAQAAGSNQEPDLFPQAWGVLAQAGGAGPTGPSGTAATVSVGTVTTLPAGSPATVTNTGTDQAPVLNFGIPQGVAGTGGGSGGGVASGSFAAMYHGVSYNTLYYALNSPNASAAEGDSVLAWVPAGCTATRLDVFSKQSGAVKVTLRAGPSSSSMSDTALVCTPSTSGSCPALGSVAIPAGSFVDLRIDGASGISAGVWTSLQCE